jgi:hypothetical protein
VDLDLEKLGLAIAFVWPGLLAVQVYRLIVPGRDLDWAHALLQGFFFTVVNYVILFPAALFVLRSHNLDLHPYLYWAALLLAWLGGPVGLPFLWRWLLRRRVISRYLLPPHASAWDWYFERRKPVFVLIHLNSGRLAGGFWGDGSFASSYPDQGDLYLSAVYKVDERGRFGEPVPQTDGLLIRRDEYSYLELFSVPDEGKGGSHGG